MIGLLGRDLVWQELLLQVGVPHFCDCAERLDRIKVLILDRAPERNELDELRRYADRGGGILSFAGNITQLWPEVRLFRRKLAYLLPDSSDLFQNVGIVDLDTVGLIPSGANLGLTPAGTSAVLAGRHKTAPVVLLPFDPAKVLRNRTALARVFPAGTSRPVFETVSRTSRGEVRRLIANALRRLCSSRGIPYLHLAYVPEGISGFGVRMDTDASPLGSVQAVARTATGSGMRFSWYIHVQAAGRDLPVLVRDVLSGQDIQLHCFEHRVYPDYESNSADISEGLRQLKQTGVNPLAVVAPYGQWTEEWSRAVADAGLTYTSEFSVGYDDVPFRPLVQGRRSTVLQVPVHPICLGRLAAACASEEQMYSYMRSLIDRQVARQEPCFIYDHPTGAQKYEQVWRQILFYGLTRCGRELNLSDYAKWWAGRESAQVNLRQESDGLEIEVRELDASLRYVVEREDSWAEFKLRPGKVRFSNLTWHRREVAKFDQTQLRRARRANLRVKYQEALRASWRRNSRGDEYLCE